MKKYYSLFSNVYPLILRNNGRQWTFYDGNTDSAMAFVEQFEPYLKVIKKCKNTPGCWSDVPTKGLNGSSLSASSSTAGIGADIASLSLEDGANISIDFWLVNHSSNSYLGYDIDAFNTESVAVVFVDVNGKKGPNLLGRDVFTFFFNNDNVYPAGMQVNSNCDVSPQITGNVGTTCTGKVLKEGGINY